MTFPPCTVYRASGTEWVQSGHRVSLGGTAVRAEGRVRGRWCECQGPPDTVGPWSLLLGLRDSRWSWCDGVPLPRPPA